MIPLDTIREKLGIAEPWVASHGAYWLNAGDSTVRDVARAMNDAAARFVTITAYELPASQGFRLEYHWDLEGQLLGVAFQIAGDTIESIYDLCEAADWIEREVHEGFAVVFTGRDYEPLLLRKGDAPGVNLRETAPNKPASAAPGHEEVAK